MGLRPVLVLVGVPAVHGLFVVVVVVPVVVLVTVGVRLGCVGVAVVM